METSRPRLISLQQARQELGGIGRTKLYALVRDGHLVALKIGSKTVICAASVEVFVASLPRVGARGIR